MGTRTQAQRTIGVTTPLGDDTLLLKSFSYSEQLGRPFQAALDLASDDPNVKFDKIVGQSVTVRLDQAGGTSRYFNGYVSRFSVGGDGRTASYTATVVPWLWLLTRTSDCRIFQNKSVPDIIMEVFRDRGFSDFEDALEGSFEPWEYCVQYRETDFNFVSRLMEQEGIYYYFRHEDGKHTLVLTNSSSTHEPYPEYDKLTFRPEPGDGDATREYVSGWAAEQGVQPGAYALTDFDFKSPRKKLLAMTKATYQHAQSAYEMYDYPGEYDQPGEGSAYSKIRVQELEAQHEVFKAATDATGVSAGFVFELTEHPREEFNEKKYLVTSAEYHVSGDAFDSSGNGSGGGATVHCRFTAISADQQFRPPRVTPRPLVQGPQTAIVVGPSGDEIYTDEYGRVKVQFHWDREGKRDEKSSCWIRVSQPWAGKAWGGVTIPRIGHEVIVGFLEGDPDQPIITGRVYNGDNPVPYALPANKTQSGIKSRSSPGGGTANFNEIRMEDKKGSEQLYFHAEKNQDIVVENDKTESVGHDETISIGHDRTETVGHDHTKTVKHNETITIVNDRTDMVSGNETRTVVKDRTRTVSKNETVTVSLTRTHTVGINESITIGAAQEITVGAAQTITVGAVQAITVGASQSNAVGASRTLSVGSNQTTSIGKDHKLTVAKKQTVSVGDDRSTDVAKNDNLKVGKKLVIDAGDEIEIKTGQASITMKKDGTILIKGKEITLDAMQKVESKAMNIKAEASTKNEVKGAMVTVEASGINTIKGSLVKIN
jgi:type VI secretion system secreted protein VgrG